MSIRNSEDEKEQSPKEGESPKEKDEDSAENQKPMSMADLIKTDGANDAKGNNNNSDDENLDEEDPNTIFSYHGNTKQYSIRSLYLFNYDNVIRKRFVWLIMHPYFDKTVILLIIVNSLFLGMIDYTQINKKVPIEK